MTHLSHDELLDAAEGRPGREHLEACASCRAEVEALAAVLREAASVVVPEPSPLFWEHFAARVRAGCSRNAPGSSATEAPASPVGAKHEGGGRILDGWRAWRVLVPVLVLLLLVVAAGRFRAPVPARHDTSNRETVAAPVPTAVPVEETAGDEESWQVFSALASEADPAGFGFGAPAPGVADDAVLQMSDEEQGELIRLLKAELARRDVRSEG
jgi:hypothetical protein